MTRVVFVGEELEGFATRGPAEHMKLNFPPAGESKLVLPEWGPDGPILQAGQQRPLNRTYTPRRWDQKTGELSVDFLLHGDGPGSTWAEQAKPGQVVAVSHQPGGAYKVHAEANWYLIGGDESALPAIGTLLEALPASCFAHVFVEVADAGEELKLESPARFHVTWLHHGGAVGTVGQRLERAVREFAGYSPPLTKRTGHGPGLRPHAWLLEVRRHKPSGQRPRIGCSIEIRLAGSGRLFAALARPSRDGSPATMQDGARSRST
jgi:NADPH-dependent ferric siderophore reductase